jgi:pimeloyl-ACP methyl ester carboxylesterase
MATAASADVAFAVLMSPPGLKGEAALRGQFERTLTWSPFVSGAMADTYRRRFARFLALVRAAHDAPGRAALASFLDGEGAALVPSYGFVPATTEGRTRLFASPWYRSQLDYDPAPALAALKGRLLVLSGTRDRVLPPEVHLPPLRAGLVGKDATFVAIADANHVLMPAWTGLPFESARLETTVDPRILARLCAWLGR